MRILMVLLIGMQLYAGSWQRSQAEKVCFHNNGLKQVAYYYVFFSYQVKCNNGMMVWLNKKELKQY